MTSRPAPILALALALLAVAPVPARAASPAVAPGSRLLVAVERIHSVYAHPSRRSARLGAIPATRPLTGVRTTLPVLAFAPGSHHRWLRVLLPGRPNGHAGWIAARSTTLTSTPWRLRVQTGRRQVTVYLHGRVARRFRIVVGKPSTPTPHGHFFVEESVRLGRFAAGAPFALALSARSDVLRHFDGGPGQIALHGRGGVGGVPGTAASHGCLRLYRRSIGWLAARIGPGVPVTITG